MLHKWVILEVAKLRCEALERHNLPNALMVMLSIFCLFSIDAMVYQRSRFKKHSIKIILRNNLIFIVWYLDVFFLAPPENSVLQNKQGNKPKTIDSDWHLLHVTTVRHYQAVLRPLLWVRWVHLECRHRTSPISHPSEVIWSSPHYQLLLQVTE